MKPVPATPTIGAGAFLRPDAAKIAGIAAAAAALAVLAGSAASARAGDAAFHRYAIVNSVFPETKTTAQRHAIVILHAWQHSIARDLKAANPNVKVLVYKNLSFVACYRWDGDPYVQQGVRCSYVEREHPEWFLKDSSGNRLTSNGYSWLSLLDVGNRAYQDTWAANVVAEAKADGWDGVFLDDVNPTLKYHMEPARVVAYPTDARWAAATRAAIANVSSQIRAAGLLAVANICCAREYSGVWGDWIQFLSGAMDEMWTKWGAEVGQGYITDWGPDGWRAQLAEVVEAERQGKYFLGTSHSTAIDTKAAVYGLATLLLATQGRSTYSLAPDYTNETWFPEYDAAAALGSPVGPYYTLGPVYRRDFTQGSVLVNPTTAAQTVALGGTYYSADGTPVTSITMEPTSGTLLRPAAPLPPSPPPPPPAADIVLSASSYVGRGNWTFGRLSWTGASSASVDVYRNGSRVATTANDGLFEYRLGKRAAGTYTFRVCEAGTTQCSNDASLRFGSGSAVAGSGRRGR
jgi:hypothetical protein